MIVYPVTIWAKNQGNAGERTKNTAAVGFDIT